METHQVTRCKRLDFGGPGMFRNATPSISSPKGTELDGFMGERTMIANGAGASTVSENFIPDSGAGVEPAGRFIEPSKPSQDDGFSTRLRANRPGRHWK